MQQHASATPDASATTPATRLDAIRAVVVAHHRPSYGVPLDGEGGTAVATAPPGSPGANPLGLAPASSTSDSTAGPTVTLAIGDGQLAGQAPATPPVVVPPVPGPPAAAPATPPAVTPPAAAPAAAAPPAQQTPPGAGPALAEAPLDSFPPEIRDYIKELRKENGDNRVKAKTAEEQAAAAATAAKTAFVEQILQATGLIADPASAAAAAELTPEQQVQAATQQVQTLTSERDTATAAAVDARRELAIWQAAPGAGGDARRLADSREFMKVVNGLDPAAADFTAQVTTAIGTAVAADSYYRAATGQTPAAALPQVPSGGDFSGGPAGTTDQPTTVDAFREHLRKSRAEARGETS